MLALQGPRSIDEILAMVVTDLRPEPPSSYYRFGFGTVCGTAEGTRISRTGYTGEDGFELYLPAERRSRGSGHELLARRRAPGPASPIGLGARDVLRLEAGMALFGHELSEEANHPLEAGVDFAIKPSTPEEGRLSSGAKGLEAARRQDPSARASSGITTPGPRVPRQGMELLVHGDEPVGARRLGGQVSPTLDTNIGTRPSCAWATGPGGDRSSRWRCKRQAPALRRDPRTPLLFPYPQEARMHRPSCAPTTASTPSPTSG